MYLQVSLISDAKKHVKNIHMQTAKTENTSLSETRTLAADIVGALLHFAMDFTFVVAVNIVASFCRCISL